MDREKFIEALENADVTDGVIKMSTQVRDLLVELLKEQEAKEVKVSTNMYTGLPITHCPKCGISLERYLYGRQLFGQINYCPKCGQAVKWNNV